MTSLVQVPDMNLVAILAGQQQLRIGAVLDHVRRTPFRGDHGVVSEVPPEVVCELLRAAIMFPGPLQLEGVSVHQENATRAVSAGRSEGAPIDAVRSTVNGMRRRVASLAREFFGLDHLHDLGLTGIRLRVEDVNARRPDAGYDQVPALHVRMRSLRAEASTARVPTEVVKLIVAAEKISLTDEPAIV